MKIAYQGVRGAFSWLAGMQQFGTQASYTGFNNFPALFEAVEKGAADFAVIPFENSLIGTIYENCDLLAAADLIICAELYLRIEHSLLILPEVMDLKQIEKAYSHIKALDQCKRFFTKHSWITPVVHEDTAGAARHVGELKQPQLAAIAHASCAELYGLKVLKSNIEDDKQNYTRFIFVKKNKPLEEKSQFNKASVLFVLKNRPGELSRVLELIARKNVNLSKIVSRPIVGKPFEYIFYADLVWEREKDSRESILELLSQIGENSEQFRCLGIYEGKVS